MLNWRGSNPVCIDCLFLDNMSNLPGGGVCNETSAPLFLRTTFVGNSSPNGGGALYNEDVGGDMVCIDCVFRNNSTSIGTGGAAMIRLLSRPVFINTLFEGNRADDGFGGAIIADTGSELLFVNVAFVGNSAETGGAATFHTGSRRLIHVTFAGNRSQLGGGVMEIGFGETEVLNSVLWDNGRFDGQPGEILHTGGSLAIRHSLVSGGCAPPFVCEAVIDADPLFVRPPAWSGTTLTDAGDLRLRVGSPAIDAGLAAYLPADLWDLDADGDTTEVLPIDILGAPRVAGLELDLGAYEGGVVVGAEPAAPPSDLALNVAPNPTNGPVTVSLVLPAAAAHVRVTVHDVLGRVVETRHFASLPPGTTRLAWDAAGLRAGVYVVRALVSGAFGARSLAQRLTVVR
jgi:predicted outer membrane repeat protein